jgi:dihydroorotate dehydrogenase
MSLYRTLLRPMLFTMAPETAHAFTVEVCRIAGAIPFLPRTSKALLEFSSPKLEMNLAGMSFANPIGLAAGWDKSGRALRMLDHLGFGFSEIGSVSARPSLGNPKPRLFRLAQDRAIVVNYGLPNEGVEVIAKRLASHRPRSPLGVNIVKTNDGPDAPECSVDEILSDYERSVSMTHRHASYLSLNLSCPNAKDGQDFFATAGSIGLLLERIEPLGIACPVFLKIAPNPEPSLLERVISEAEPYEFVRGFLFNLPAGKPHTISLKTPRSQWERMPGAVAGKPVENLINECIRQLYTRMPSGRFVIIGAGGVFTAEDAYLKIRLGASLVQLYTALVYEGPGIVKRINRGLVELLRRDGCKNIREAIGAGVVDRSRQVPGGVDRCQAPGSDR